MSKILRPLIVFVIIGGVLVWLALGFVRVKSNQVDLNVDRADLRDVARKIERQTHERIFVHRDINATVTLRVTGAPMPELMEMLSRQIRCRSYHLQPLYSTAESFQAFEKAARGEVDANSVGWSNLATLVRSPLPPSRRNDSGETQTPITLQVTNRPMRLVSLAFSRIANVNLVAEDGTPPNISIVLRGVPESKAVEKVASAAGRQTKSCYCFLPASGGEYSKVGPPGRNFGPGERPPGESPSGFMPGPPNAPPGGLPPPSPEMMERMNQDYTDLMSILPLDQRLRLKAERETPPDPDQMFAPGPRPPGKSPPSQAWERQQQWLQRSSVRERVNQDREDAGKLF